MDIQSIARFGPRIVDEDVAVMPLLCMPVTPFVVLVLRLKPGFELHKVSLADIHIPRRGISAGYGLLCMLPQCRGYLDRTFESAARYRWSR